MRPPEALIAEGLNWHFGSVYFLFDLGFMMIIMFQKQIIHDLNIVWSDQSDEFDWEFESQNG